MLLTITAPAADVSAGTIRFHGLVREIDWCQEVGNTIRYRVHGVTYAIPKQDVEALDLKCSRVIDLARDDTPLARYLKEIHARVHARWKPPRDAPKDTRAVVLFHVARDGQLIGEPLVEKGSGLTLFDETALRAVKEARPFAPLPDELGAPSLLVHVNFGYQWSRGPAAITSESRRVMDLGRAVNPLRRYAPPARR